ncbi:MAG: carbohydrate-binding domain-containing protein [Oscillospiraceae bacterium]|nr:carbohydrate-binding domain-containing protein [Oscillospiraceae bacterium]
MKSKKKTKTTMRLSAKVLARLIAFAMLVSVIPTTTIVESSTPAVLPIQLLGRTTAWDNTGGGILRSNTVNIAGNGPHSVTLNDVGNRTFTGLAIRAAGVGTSAAQWDAQGTSLIAPFAYENASVTITSITTVGSTIPIVLSNAENLALVSPSWGTEGTNPLEGRADVELWNAFHMANSRIAHTLPPNTTGSGLPTQWAGGGTSDETHTQDPAVIFPSGTTAITVNFTVSGVTDGDNNPLNCSVCGENPHSLTCPVISDGGTPTEVIDLGVAPTATSGNGWVRDGSVYEVINGANLVFTGTSENNRRITVRANATVHLTFRDLNARISTTNTSPLSLGSGSTVVLTLEGENSVQGGSNGAGIRVPSETQLIINGSGTLNATGNRGGAGIGGSVSFPAGTVVINSGIVNAINTGNATGGVGNGAGIGGGGGGAGGSVTINGGVVTARGNNDSSGIGHGRFYSGTTGTLNVSGGAVLFTSGFGVSSLSLVNGIVFNGSYNSTFYGTDVSVTNDVTLPANYTLTVPSGRTLSVPNGQTFTNNGVVINLGTINYGSENSLGTWVGKPYIIPCDLCTADGVVCAPCPALDCVETCSLRNCAKPICPDCGNHDCVNVCPTCALCTCLCNCCGLICCGNPQCENGSTQCGDTDCYECYPPPCTIYGGTIAPPARTGNAAAGVTNGNSESTGSSPRTRLDFNVLDLIDGTCIKPNDIYGFEVVIHGPSGHSRQFEILVNNIASPRFQRGSAPNAERLWIDNTAVNTVRFMNVYTAAADSRSVKTITPFVANNASSFSFRLFPTNEHPFRVTEIKLLGLAQSATNCTNSALCTEGVGSAQTARRCDGFCVDTVVLGVASFNGAGNPETVTEWSSYGDWDALFCKVCFECGCDLICCEYCNGIDACDKHVCETCETTCVLHVCTNGLCDRACDKLPHICVDALCNRDTTCNAHICTICSVGCNLHVCTNSLCNRTCELHVCNEPLCSRTCELYVCTQAPCNRVDISIVSDRIVITNLSGNFISTKGLYLMLTNGVTGEVSFLPMPSVIIRSNASIQFSAAGIAPDLKRGQTDFSLIAESQVGIEFPNAVIF